LQRALREALAAFLAVLDRYTLADLTSSPALAPMLEKT
jgi:DNA-binding IscR family transcriptional regulator